MQQIDLITRLCACRTPSYSFPVAGGPVLRYGFACARHLQEGPETILGAARGQQNSIVPLVASDE